MSNLYVVSSHFFPEHLKPALEKKLQDRFGEHAIVYEIDPSLGLGFVVQVGETEYYYSLEHEISHILTELTI
jgi:F0F1-type ATP synthase delta subunit